MDPSRLALTPSQPPPQSFGSKALRFGVELGVSVVASIAVYASYRLVMSMVSGSNNSVVARKMATMLDRPELASVTLTDYEANIAMAVVVSSNDMNLTFNDIGGLDDQIQEVHDNIILPILLWKNNCATRQTTHPTGVLLYGKPGTGKSLTAKALAKEIGATFMQVNSSHLMDKWMGESDKKIVALFGLARKLAPTIVFIDEIDALLRSRGNDSAGNYRNLQSLLLSEWDGLRTSCDAPVVVLGATNRIMDIDDAFLRRMPVQINIPSPTLEAREDILNKLLMNEHVHGEVIIREIAMRTDGCSGSDLKEIVRLAGLNRMRGALATAKAAASEGQSGKFVRYNDQNVVAMASAASIRPLSVEDFEFALSKRDLSSNVVDDYNREQREGQGMDALLHFMRSLKS